LLIGVIALGDQPPTSRRTPSRRYVRQADLLLDLIHGDRTRRSARGLHSRLASDSADDCPVTNKSAQRVLLTWAGLIDWQTIKAR
jgi:hypothetical protein